MARQKQVSELTIEEVFEYYKQLGFQSQIAVFKMIKEDLKQQHEMAAVKADSLHELFSPQ